ncbi:MAG: type II secretion system F family protein [Terriglobia bacterium]|nr:type II secretion system F family protein [Terriglobia bacterium]
MRPTKTEKTLETRLESIERGNDDAAIEPDAPPDIVKRANLSDIPLLEVLLQRFAPAKRLQEYLSQADLDWSVGRVVAGTLFLLVVVPFFVGLFLPNVVIELVAGIIAASGLYLFIYVKRSMRFDRFNQLLPEAIDLLTRALKAGHSINAAIEMVSREIPDPVGTEFRRTFEEQNFGLPMREAMTNLAARVPIADVQFLVTAILVQKETGGNLVEILEKTASVLRERLRLKGQLAIYTAQGRLTGWILAGLPFFLFIGINVVNPNYGKILIEDPLGRNLIYAGLILMAIGGYVIRKIIDVKV